MRRCQAWGWAGPAPDAALILARCHGGRRQPRCDPEGCATVLGAVGGGRTPPPWLTQTLGRRVGRSAAGLPGGGGGRWVPQHTYLKMIPMTR